MTDFASTRATVAERPATTIFHHLACAVRFRAASPIALAHYTRDGPGDSGWYVSTLRELGRDQLAKTRAVWIGSPSAVFDGTAMHVTRHPIIAWPGRHRPGHGFAEPGDSTEPLRLYCRKCTVEVLVTPHDLSRAAEQHPGQLKRRDVLIAYLADQGEVIWALDRHAEELARRDRRATRRSVADGAGIRPKSKLGV